MRTQRLLAFVLPLVGFCAACDPTAPLPGCVEGSYAATNELGELVCWRFAADRAAAVLPACRADEALTSDAQGVHCVKRLDVEDLEKTREAINQLRGVITQVKQAYSRRGLGPSSASTFVGVTSVTSRGRITSQDGLSGVPVAALLCAEQYGTGAHLCSVYELYRSAAMGALANQTVARSWLYFPAWNTVPTLRNADRDRGLGDTCGGYIVDTSSEGYRGVTVEWNQLSTGSPGFTFHSGDDARCVYSWPISCCR